MKQPENGDGAADCKYVLRFDSAEQRAQLKARAALNRRTLNAEILFLIGRGIEMEEAHIRDEEAGNEKRLSSGNC